MEICLSCNSVSLSIVQLNVIVRARCAMCDVRICVPCTFRLVLNLKLCFHSFGCVLSVFGVCIPMCVFFITARWWWWRRSIESHNSARKDIVHTNKWWWNKCEHCILGSYLNAIKSSLRPLIECSLECLVLKFEIRCLVSCCWRS